MKNKIIVHREYNDERVGSITCDICKKEYKGTNWEKPSAYDTLETTVKIVTGSNFGSEGGDKLTRSFDICPNCFEKILIPTIEKLGAKLLVEESLW